VTAVRAGKWEALGCSVRGASHDRSGQPNQDAWQIGVTGDHAGMVMAVADGHGHRIHARSDRGSRQAVETTIPLLTQWLGRQSGVTEQAIRDSAARLPAQILEAWRQKVDADLADDPVKEAPEMPASATNTVADDSYVLYGSTLVAAAVNERFATYIQIGDGDLMVVSAGKSTRRLPSRRDVPLNLTESLCQRDAESRFRVEVEFFAGPPPELLMLSTDGYANSFRDAQEFDQVGLDIRGYLAHEGSDWVNERVETWLKETSVAGSGDDVTLALAWRPEAGGQIRLEPPPPSRRRIVILVASLVLVLVLASVLGSWAVSRWNSLTPQVSGQPAAKADDKKPEDKKADDAKVKDQTTGDKNEDKADSKKVEDGKVGQP
jgi:hypothetical protein